MMVYDEAGMPEKRTPHRDLASVKAAAPRMGVTTAALRDAAALGIDRSGITSVLMTLESRHFHKAMTSYRDEAEWQDVYRVPHDEGLLYVKFRDDAVLSFMLLSFKER